MASLGRETGIPTRTLSDYSRGKLPRADKAVAIAKALNRSVEWLFGEVERGDGPADLVAIHEIDLAYGLGGAYADGEVESSVLHFPRAWLETITRTPPTMLTFARGRGDSMQPTILDGDIVLLDRSMNRVFEQDAIWALTVGEIAMIKRLRMRGGRVHMLSDNDRIPPDDADVEDVNIVGRVIFIGRRI